MNIYADDEPIVAPQDPSGQQPKAFLTAKTNVTIISKNKAPLKQMNVNVLLKLTGAGSGNERPGVDIVMVLDVSKNMMMGNKLEGMKTAMQFLIRKLSPIDRLSVVTVGKVSDRLCVLRQMTDKAQSEIEESVNALSVDEKCEKGTNISAGLQTAVQVLKSRRSDNKGRVEAIMLMSSGDQIAGTRDPTEVSHSDLPVYTFGFGHDYNPKVLNDIANKSNGGTFSTVEAEITQPGNLALAFSQCLAGLLTVAVQKLVLVVTSQSLSKIINVSAGSYPSSNDQSTGSAKVIVGDLYSKEMRKVIVDLGLAVASEEGGEVVLLVQCLYSANGKEIKGTPLLVNVTRMENPEAKEMDELTMEQMRIDISKKMIKAREFADQGKMEDAQIVLVQAQCDLEDAVGNQPNPLINMLRYELSQYVKFVQTSEIYEKKGKAFALASETSHTRQRFAARGHAEMLRLFTTPRMDAYLEQASSFVEDPSKPLPTSTDDAKQEMADDPFSNIIEPILAQINETNKALFANINSYLGPHLEMNIKSIQTLRESLEKIQLLIKTVDPTN